MSDTRVILWTSGEAELATGGRAASAWTATGVSIDSRTVKPGDLFIALKGPNFDGHAFVEAALAAGAAAAMVSTRPAGANNGEPLLIVDDTFAALGRLAAAARERTSARVAAVTGSVGKTSAKETLRAVLGAQGAATANVGSLNNHWGVPLSLARMPKTTDFGIFEIGMNHPGEIDPLSRLVRPDVALITTIEGAHTAFFDSVEQIADAKAEIFAGLGGDGIAVLNRDNHYFRRLSDVAQAHGVGRIVGFGADADSDARLIECEVGPEGSRVVADMMGRLIAYRIAVPGRHWVSNSLGVLATATALGGDVDAAAAALETIEAPDGRGRRHLLNLAAGTVTVIDESYNASPASMRAAFKVLARTPKGPGGRRIAVLGDMLELGEESGERHAELAEAIQRAGIDLVFTTGTEMRHLRVALPVERRGAHAYDSAGLAPLVCNAVRPGDVVTIKGSAGSRMRVVLAALKDRAAETGGGRKDR